MKKNKLTSTLRLTLMLSVLFGLVGCNQSSICIDLAEERCYQDTINHYNNLSQESLKFYEHCIQIERLPIMIGGC